MIKKAAETEEPMIPPTWEKAPNFSDIVDAVAATTMQVMRTTLERPGMD